MVMIKVLSVLIYAYVHIPPNICNSVPLAHCVCVVLYLCAIVSCIVTDKKLILTDLAILMSVGEAPSLVVVMS